MVLIRVGFFNAKGAKVGAKGAKEEHGLWQWVYRAWLQTRYNFESCINLTIAMKKYLFSITLASLLIESFNIASINAMPFSQISIKANSVVGDADTSPAKILNGNWEGTYVCGQGLTKLKLILQAENDHKVNAIFNFSAHDSNPSVPSGSFRMKGTYQLFDVPEAYNLLELKATSWLERPNGYETVDLLGTIIDAGKKIVGRVNTPNCSNFELIKRD